jgi:hypothetical protein
MTFTAEFMLQIMVALGSGISVYAAIRADLATLHEKTKRTETVADMAHRRIDEMTRFHNENITHR